MAETDTSTKQTALPGSHTGPEIELENYDVVTSTSRYREEHSNPPRPESPAWNYRVERDRDTANITGILALSPDAAIQVRLSYNDTLYRRRTLRREDGRRKIEWRLFLVGPIYYTDGSLMVDVLNCPSPVRYSREEIRSRDLDERAGDWAEAVPAADLVESLAVEEGTWNHTSPPGCDFDADQPGETVWFTDEPIAPGSDREQVDSVTDLEFEQLAGAGALETVNSFLEGGADGLVDHRLGGVTGMKASFAARHPEMGIVSVAVIEVHPNPKIMERGDTLYLSRLASHPTRPANTSSWMLAQIRDWVREQGYDQLVATAGIEDNSGTCYKAAGFELDESNTGWADGGGWTNREGRKTRRDGHKWFRRRWILPRNKKSNQR